MKMLNNSLRPIVFWPSFLVASGIVVVNLIDEASFAAGATAINNVIMANFAWAFSLLTFIITLIAGYLFFSKVGDVKIGGKDATPMLTKWKWFTITLSTTLSAGVLFWSTAEPLYYLHQPPESLGLTPGSFQAALFSLSTVLMHWTYAPYAIYAVPSVCFALVFFNLKKPYSLASTIEPALGHRKIGDKGAQILDSACLFTLIFGMAATMGTSILILMGGLNYFFDIPTNGFTMGITVIVITASFVGSAVTGLHKGITILAKWNSIGLFAIATLMLFAGPTLFQFAFGVEAFGQFLTNFINKLTFTGAASGDQWPKWWSLYYWAIWMAWAPLSALFLGYIARGYTVKQLIIMTMLLPASFTVLWMWIFGGTAIKWDMDSNNALYDVLQNQGVENVLYSVFDKLPATSLLAGVMLLVAFLSFVTSAHSNALVMSQICTRGLSADNLKANKPLIVMWGSFVAFISWAMISFAGIDGIKMVSNLGGVFAILVLVLMSASAVSLANDPRILKDRIIRDYEKEAAALHTQTSK
ncbi:BCCT transporter [Photobacterium sanctipauli]|uniref:BCCT transporter n=1 Tax=Photobacterium sanctipauli TaxID=1342794 RepID=A0A2T3NN42_9GAMM|nr:BCCT family transporter [Photobacterium sanctipauli]PSW16934.1 BCCT transporter [Photobacterium sanctipauli]